MFSQPSRVLGVHTLHALKRCLSTTTRCACLSTPHGVDLFDLVTMPPRVVVNATLRPEAAHLAPADCSGAGGGAAVPYATALAWQRHLQAEVHAGTRRDTVLMVEHKPVYTLGRTASVDNLRFDPSSNEYELHRVERGGEVTYHGPGQVVVYPVLNLRRYRQDLHWYLRVVEEIVIAALAARYGVVGERVPELTGVWVGGMKVAAVGIAVQRWVTMHGLALNVCPNMEHFDHIVPCGIADRPVTCLSTLLRDGLGGGATSPGGQLHELAPRKRMLDAASAMRASLQHVLGIELLPRAATDLPLAAQPAPMKPLLRGKQPPQQHQQQAPDR